MTTGTLSPGIRARWEENVAYWLRMYHAIFDLDSHHVENTPTLEFRLCVSTLFFFFFLK